MDDESSSTVVVFYGLAINPRQLKAAGNAWKTVRGAYVAMRIILARKLASPTTLLTADSVQSHIGMLPVEVIELIVQLAIDSAVAQASDVLAQAIKMAAMNAYYEDDFYEFGESEHALHAQQASLDLTGSKNVRPTRVMTKPKTLAGCKLTVFLSTVWLSRI